MRLYIARHGESIANEKWPDYDNPAEMNGPLTERGRNQANALATWMKKEEISLDAIYASSMVRTKETAGFVSEAYNLPLKLSDLIREGSTAYWDHQPIPDEKLTVYQDNDFHKTPYLPFDRAVPDMESYAHLVIRVGKFLSELIAKHEDQTVLVVGHGWVKNAFVDIIFNVGPFRRCSVFPEFTALSSFNYQKSDEMYGPWAMKFINQSEHLAVAGLERPLE